MKLFLKKIMLGADYFQIYLHEKNLSKDNFSGPDWWTTSDEEKRISIKNDNRLIIIAPFRDFIVPVIIEIFSETPPFDTSCEWDIINENWLNLIDSQSVVIRGIFEEEEEAFSYQFNSNQVYIRVYYGGKQTITPDGLLGDDYYLIQIFPSACVSNPRPSPPIGRNM